MKTQIKQLVYGILATSCFGLSCTSCTLGPKEYQWPPKDGEPMVTLLGPVYETGSETQAPLFKALEQAMTIIVENQQTHLPEFYQKRISGMNHQLFRPGYSNEEEWGSIKSLSSKAEDYGLERMAGILESSENRKHGLEMAIRMQPTIDPQPASVTLEGYRLILHPSGKGQAEWFTQEVKLTGRKAGEEFQNALIWLLAKPFAQAQKSFVLEMEKCKKKFAEVKEQYCTSVWLNLWWSSCKSIPKIIFNDLEKVRSLTAEELAENAKVLSEYDKKEEILEELKVTDIAEKKEPVKEKEVVEEAKKEFKVLTTASCNEKVPVWKDKNTAGVMTFADKQFTADAEPIRKETVEACVQTSFCPEINVEGNEFALVSNFAGAQAICQMFKRVVIDKDTLLRLSLTEEGSNLLDRENGAAWHSGGETGYFKERSGHQEFIQAKTGTVWCKLAKPETLPTFVQRIYIWSDGSKYEGEFKDGKPNGRGTLTFPDGKKYVGGFKEGKFWNTSKRLLYLLQPTPSSSE